MTLRDDGFLHALQQEPDDDGLRLIYADWLEDPDDGACAARAELIRVQVELAVQPPATPREVERAAALAARQDELLAEWEHVWLGSLADGLVGWAFRRGLVESIKADASVFLARAPEWFAAWPTLAVAKLTRAQGHVAELAACPWLAHLRGLDLSDNDIDEAALSHLTASRFICLLRAVDLSGNPISPRGAGLLASASFPDELSELHLGRCGLGEAGMEQLLGRRSRQWRRLDLSGNGLGRRALVWLADSSVMPELAALDLASNPLGDSGVAVLADSPNAAGLIELGLCSSCAGDEALTSLARSGNLTGLRSLDLRGHSASSRFDRAGVDWGGLAELARSPLLGQLRRLLLGPAGPSNGWVAAALRGARPPRRQTVVPDRWATGVLRQSRYLMPSQLVECDLDELWWLGDTRNRERLSDLWLDW